MCWCVPMCLCFLDTALTALTGQPAAHLWTGGMAVVRIGVRRNAPENTRRSKPILLRGSVVPVEMRQALTQMAGFMV